MLEMVLLRFTRHQEQTIPKTKFELKIVKIRGVESRGMLCSENELNLSRRK